MSSRKRNAGEAKVAKSEETPEVKVEKTATADKDIHNPDSTQEVSPANATDEKGSETTTGVSETDKGSNADKEALDKRLQELEAREKELEAREKNLVPVIAPGDEPEVEEEVSNVEAAKVRMVKVTAISNHETNIGGKKYSFAKGHSYEVPEDVAAILSNAFIAVRK